MDSDEDEVSGSRPGIETTGDSSEAAKTSADSTESSSRRRGRNRRVTTAAASASSGGSEGSARVLRNRTRNSCQPKSVPTEKRPKSVPHGRGRPAAESRPQNTHVVQPVKKKSAAKKATPGPKLSRSRKGKGTPAHTSPSAECKPESEVEAPSSGDVLTGGPDNVAGPSPDDGPPLKDDPNDVVCQPETKTEKSRRRAAAQQKEVKKEEEENDLKKEEAAKVVGNSEDGVGNDAEPARKRSRQQKDDKAPRVPKRRKKPPVQYVRCEMEGCGTVLAHPRYLQHHIKYQHLLKKKYVCDHPSCGRLFRLQKQLLRHAKHHTDQRDYICEYCARAFKSSHNLAVHRMIHTGEKPIQCEICGFTCRQKASLNWHMKKHDAEASYQFSCSICGKKFEKKDSVVAHKAKSHPEVLIAEALAANGGSVISTPIPESAPAQPEQPPSSQEEAAEEEEEVGGTLTPLQQVVLPLAPQQTQIAAPQGPFLQLQQQQQQQQEGPTLLQLTTAPPPHLSTQNQFIQLSPLPVCAAPDPQASLLTLSSVTSLAPAASLAGPPAAGQWAGGQGEVPGEGELWERVVVGEVEEDVAGMMWEGGGRERRKESEGAVWGREGERQILLQCAEVHGDSLI